jgi:hypothetical protein
MARSRVEMPAAVQEEHEVQVLPSQRGWHFSKSQVANILQVKLRTLYR